MPPERDKQRRFMAAYARIHDGFLRYCSAVTFERMDVEDLVQEVLLSAYRKFDDLADPEKLQHYMIRAARNRSVSGYRSKKKILALAQVQSDRWTAKGVSPEQLADVQLLYRAIRRLPPNQRDAILLYEISGYGQADVAELLGCSVPAVKMYLQRGRRRLRRLLTDPGHHLSDLLGSARSLTL